MRTKHFWSHKRTLVELLANRFSKAICRYYEFWLRTYTAEIAPTRVSANFCRVISSTQLVEPASVWIMSMTNTRISVSVW